jgi:hypothetical protein
MEFAETSSSTSEKKTPTKAVVETGSGWTEAEEVTVAQIMADEKRGRLEAIRRMRRRAEAKPTHVPDRKSRWFPKRVIFVQPLTYAEVASQSNQDVLTGVRSGTGFKGYCVRFADGTVHNFGMDEAAFDAYAALFQENPRAAHESLRFAASATTEPESDPQNEALSCNACGLRIPGTELAVPGVTGAFCGIECLETHLFASTVERKGKLFGNCRWCGAAMEQTYTGINSRLCSEDCSTNYHAHVRGDRSAAVGTGTRLLIWLQKHQPAFYSQLSGLQQLPVAA